MCTILYSAGLFRIQTDVARESSLCSVANGYAYSSDTAVRKTRMNRSCGTDTLCCDVTFHKSITSGRRPIIGLYSCRPSDACFHSVVLHKLTHRLRITFAKRA